MTASWPWLVCLKRANAVSARYQENLSTRGQKSAGPVSGGPPIDCRASYPNARSAGGLVSLRLVDRREAHLREQRGPPPAVPPVVRPPPAQPPPPRPRAGPTPPPPPGGP